MALVEDHRREARVRLDLDRFRREARRGGGAAGRRAQRDGRGERLVEVVDAVEQRLAPAVAVAERVVREGEVGHRGAPRVPSLAERQLDVGRPPDAHPAMTPRPATGIIIIIIFTLTTV